MPPEISHSNQGKSESGKMDLAFKAFINKAEESGMPTAIAGANNKYASWLMSQGQRRYGEAVPHFQEVAEIQTSQDNRIGAADAYSMLGSCLFLIGDVKSLKKAEKAAEKAAGFYPDSEDFADKRRTEIVKQVIILENLARQTKNKKYFDKGTELCMQHADTLKGSETVWQQFKEAGLAKAA